MSELAAAREFLEKARQAISNEELLEALAGACDAMGFQYFALTHHLDFPTPSSGAVRLHNYPASWVAWFDENRLGVSDPIHRASHVTTVGFAWEQVPALIKLTGADRNVLDKARREGIGNGFTVPAHVPGEASGSCSFAISPAGDLPEANLALAQLVGAFAFEAARRINRAHFVDPARPPSLTERQRDCVLWMARGKSDWEIARILGLSEETVTQHLKQARERYDVAKRPLLAVRALFDGHICFGDVFGN
jgi:LuxR family transcriptional regulator, quorum-sensing system regulator CciR